LTLEVLASREGICLPDDIEPLIERVYANIDPEQLEQSLLDKWAKHLGEQSAERMIAKSRVIPPPTVEDSPFGDLRVFLREDDDPALHMQLKAATRLGPPSVELVCVEQTDAGLRVGDGVTAVLDPAAVPDWHITERLVRRSIGVTTPSVVHGLTHDAASQPSGWSKSPLLRHRRLLAFTNNIATVGAVTLVLDDELGLCITTTKMSVQKGKAP
jgi:hypothetical protein